MTCRDHTVRLPRPPGAATWLSSRRRPLPEAPGTRLSAGARRVQPAARGVRQAGLDAVRAGGRRGGREPALPEDGPAVGPLSAEGLAGAGTPGVLDAVRDPAERRAAVPVAHLVRRGHVELRVPGGD